MNTPIPSGVSSASEEQEAGWDALERMAEQARASLDTANQARERALGISRELVRTSANSIRASHRGDEAVAVELLRHAAALAASLRDLRDRRGEIFFTGYVQDALKEFAEASALFAMITDSPVPDAVKLDIPWAAYLNGLAETIGELRRHCLDLLREGRIQDAAQILDRMDSIFSVLVAIDYPDAITGGLRRSTDMARGILERTRGDLTTAALQDRLAQELQRWSAGASTP
jgi:translin